MDPLSQEHSIDEVRMMDMVAYLSGLGYEPSRVRNNDYWYLSPLRGEHTPSFKVNRALNRWYDHGLGAGGNIIDFGIRYFSCSVGEFLQRVGAGFSFHLPLALPRDLHGEHRIEVIKEGPLASFPLLRYLGQREVPLGIAGKYCREVRYRLNGRDYFGIGFRNDSGGYELRNPFFKASSSPKGITTFGSGSVEADVFEGFMDFLSFMAVNGGKDPERDVVVLNSLAFFDKARPFMEAHKVVNLYLDRDAAGQNCSRNAIATSEKYKDRSGLYEGYKDVNEWLSDKRLDDRKKRRLKL
jgi:hypothetical protein